MDITKRQITKISREASKLAGRMLRDQGVGTAEFDVIHVIRKNPGITQAGIREQLGLDKGALARQIASLETKGFLIRKGNPKMAGVSCSMPRTRPTSLRTPRPTLKVPITAGCWRPCRPRSSRSLRSCWIESISVPRTKAGRISPT